MAIDFPIIDPVAFSIGPISVRWYALAYLAGILGGWYLAVRLTRLFFDAPGRTLNARDIDDLVPWIVLGIVAGGRLGYVLFYNLDYFALHPVDALKIWEGGMSFHGGLVGVGLAMAGFAFVRGLPLLHVADVVCVVVPLGLFFGRLANFVNAELVGRITDVPWAVIFPDTDGQPRHPSQLYQAALEGIVIFSVMMVLVRVRSIRMRYGFLTGFFLMEYATFRFLVEFVREPDAQLGFVALEWMTMGQILCVPMIMLGGALMAFALRPPRADAHRPPPSTSAA